MSNFNTTTALYMYNAVFIRYGERYDEDNYILSQISSQIKYAGEIENNMEMLTDSITFIDNEYNSINVCIIRDYDNINKATKEVHSIIDDFITLLTIVDNNIARKELVPVFNQLMQHSIFRREGLLYFL